MSDRHRVEGAYHIFYDQSSWGTYTLTIIINSGLRYKVDIVMDDVLTPKGYRCDSPHGPFYVDSPADIPYDFLRILRTDKNLPPKPIYIHTTER